MEILTKYLPFFRLTLFLLALPVFGLAQQFPVNNQKIVQGVGTAAQGIISYSSLPPTTNPSTTTWRHVTSMHVDTVERVQYLYKRPRWYAASLLVQSNPPPATESSGSTTVDYTETIWQNTTDSTSYYYEEKQQCWQPVGTVVRDTTPVSLAATGTSAAVCYEYSLWYNSTNDSLYAYTAGAWLAVGSGGGGTAGAVDSIVVLQDSIIVGYSEAVEVTRDTIGYPVPDISDVPGLADSIAAAPSGTGTNLRIPVWTGTNSLGSSTLLQSATGQTLDANLAFQITGGTTASRPTGAAGMMYWNTSNGWWDYHNGTAWFNPLRAATATGLGTSTHVGYFDANGAMTGSSNMTYNATTGKLLILGTSGDNYLEVRNPSGAIAYYGATDLTTGAGYDNGIIVGYNGGGIIYNRENTPMTLATNNIIRMRIAASGEVGIGTTSPDRLLHPELSDAVTNAISFPLRLTHITSGTAAAGSGAGLEFEAESAGGTNRVAGTIENPYTTATNAAEVSDLVFRTMRAGTLTESLRSLGNGTLQVGTLSGTATQWLGATAGNILTTITPGYGLSLASGGVRVDTAALKGQFLPLTLSGATTVNTAGQTLRIRDAGGYPDVYMNSNYWTAASDVNTFIDVGSTSGQMQLNSASRTIIAAATNVELQAGITGEMRFDGDSLVLEGVYPVGTASDSVLVRDASNNRVKLVAQSDMEGVWLKTVLESGNNVDVLAVDQPAFEISDLAGFNILNATDINLEGGNIIELTTNNLTLVGNYPVGTSTDSVLVRDGATGRVNLRAQSSIEGTWLKPELEAGNDVSIAGTEANELGVSGLRYLGLGVEKSTGDTQRAFIEMSSDDGAGTFAGDTILGSFYGGTASDVVAAMYLLKSGTNRIKGETEIYLDSPNVETAGAVQVGDITNGNTTALPGYTSGNVLTTTTLGASLTLSSGALSTAQSFFNDYDASITLTGVTSTPDTIDADSNTKSNDWGFNPTTNTYTYNGVSGRYYSVSLSAQARSSSGAELYLDVYRNGTITSAKAQAVVGGSTEPVALHGQAILLLTNGDTINAKASCSGGTEDFDIENYSLVIKEI